MRSMLTLHDIMTTDVICVAPDTPLADVVALLRAEAITGVPVVQQNRVVGVLSASDILEFTEEGNLSDEFGQQDRLELFEAYTAADIMTRKLCALASSATLVAAAREMVNTGVHRVLVIDEGKLVGIVTCTDFVRVVAEAKDLSSSL